jgi:hypothetical protein
MYDALTCEMTAKSVCLMVGGTYNADFCKAGGPSCDHALVEPRIDGQRCSSDSDCPYTNLEDADDMRVCCSVYENFAKAACTGIDSAKLGSMFTAWDCTDSNCISGSGSLRAVLVPVSVMSLLMSFAFVF